MAFVRKRVAEPEQNDDDSGTHGSRSADQTDKHGAEREAGQTRRQRRL